MKTIFQILFFLSTGSVVQSSLGHLLRLFLGLNDYSVKVKMHVQKLHGFVVFYPFRWDIIFFPRPDLFFFFLAV